MFSGSGSVNAARTLAVSPANSGATGSWRPGKTQLMAQARPGSFFALACGTRGLAAGRSIPCQAVKRRSSSTVKLGIAVLFSEPPGPWSARSANCAPQGLFNLGLDLRWLVRGVEVFGHCLQTGFLLSSSCPVNASRTLAVSPANCGVLDGASGTG